MCDETKKIATAVSQYFDLPMKPFESVCGPSYKKGMVDGKWGKCKDEQGKPILKDKDPVFKVTITAFAPKSRDG
jgi:hypothetical protein